MSHFIDNIGATVGRPTFKTLIFASLLTSLVACNDTDTSTENSTTPTPALTAVTGVAQKGAFRAGSSVTLQELTASAKQGNTRITSTVSTHLGTYSIATTLRGWAELSVSGDYFDEYNNQTSSTPITLNSIQEITGEALNFNVNLFSHFVAARTINRVQNSKQSLADAKSAAENELQAALNLPAVSTARLDLQQGDDENRTANAMLLLFSGGFMAAEGDADLLSTLTDDFKVDGAFDVVNLQVIAAKAAEENLLDTLASNLSNQGTTHPPDVNDLAALPDWIATANDAPTTLTAAVRPADGTIRNIAPGQRSNNAPVNLAKTSATDSPAQRNDLIQDKKVSVTIKPSTVETNVTADSVEIKPTENITDANEVPVAGDVVARTNEDKRKAIQLDGSDGDEADSLSYIIIAAPTHGKVSITGNIATYSPTSNYSGIDGFTYKVNDGTADSNIAIVNITVNNTPHAYPVTIRADENITKAFMLEGDDEDGGNLTYIKMSDPGHGMVNITYNEATYTPNANYNGSDSFTYKVNDGFANSNIATVNISVNDTPVASAVTIHMDTDKPKAILLAGSDSDGDLITYIKVTDPAYGTVTLTDNTATYTPQANYRGSDSFTYKVNDGAIDSSVATVTISVGKAESVSVADVR